MLVSFLAKKAIQFRSVSKLCNCIEMLLNLQVLGESFHINQFAWIWTAKQHLTSVYFCQLCYIAIFYLSTENRVIYHCEVGWLEASVNAADLVWQADVTTSHSRAEFAAAAEWTVLTAAASLVECLSVRQPMAIAGSATELAPLITPPWHHASLTHSTHRPSINSPQLSTIVTSHSSLI